MKTIVVSAVNLNRGGTLSILRECLHCLSKLAETKGYYVIALVYDKKLAYYPSIHYVELQWPKRTWVNRIWCEYITMKGISRRLSPVFLWLSLHDITPTVIALNRIVYCHNSFPFYAWKMRDLLFAPKIVLFALFSKYAYRKNIHKNNYVIVQQQWLRNEFVRLFNLSAQSIIVAPPSFHPVKHDFFISKSSLEYSFFFPAVADSHKNFECICSAAHLLEQSLGANKFRVYITVEGTENSYARWLYHKWSKNRALSFIGYLNEEELSEYYQRCDCLIFPSKVETWGLPISEFAIYNKPMLLADLPYAHETAGGCSRVAFFNPDSPNELAVHMKRLIQGNTYSLRSVENTIIPPPTAYSWKDLFDFITK